MSFENTFSRHLLKEPNGEKARKTCVSHTKQTLFFHEKPFFGPFLHPSIRGFLSKRGFSKNTKKVLFLKKGA